MTTRPLHFWQQLTSPFVLYSQFLCTVRGGQEAQQRMSLALHGHLIFRTAAKSIVSGLGLSEDGMHRAEADEKRKAENEVHRVDDRATGHET